MPPGLCRSAHSVADCRWKAATVALAHRARWKEKRKPDRLITQMGLILEISTMWTAVLLLVQHGSFWSYRPR